MPRPGVVLALGTVAHRAVLAAVGQRPSRYAFAHAARFDLGDGLTLISSYHCSRYNTQTRRLTEHMFRDVMRAARVELDATKDRGMPTDE